MSGSFAADHSAPNSPEELRALVEAALLEFIPSSSLPGNERLNEAIRCAVFPGGKRFRPVFALLAAHAAGASPKRALSAACAIEFLHCSSLVFDDLPCMDDAGLRRNRPSLHKEFGEPTALLAGLALFNEAYRLLGRYPHLVAEAVNCVGVDGMIGGQAVEFGTECSDIRSRDCKTSGLLRLTFAAGGCCAGICTDSKDLLADCGERLGRAYQALDDLLDDCGATGKTAAQDTRHCRPSHTSDTNPTWALAEVEACCNELCLRFGRNALPLVNAVQRTFSQFASTGLVAV